MQVEQPVWPPLPGGPPPPLPLPGGGPAHFQQYEPPRYDQQPPWQAQGSAFPHAPPHPAPEQPQGKRKKRGKRGSGLEARQRGLKRQQQPTALGFFGQVPASHSQHNVPASLQDLRRENRARAAQHFGGGGGGRAQQQHGPGRSGGHRRSRGGKAFKMPKRLAPTPRPMPLTPAAGNPLDTPANVGHVANATAGADRLEAEGLQAGLDWYGTNENSAALFLAGQHLTTSDSEFEDDWGELEDGEAAPQGNGHAHDDAHSGGSGSGGSGGGEAGGGEAGAPAPGGLYDEAALPRAVRARLVEQEAYIAELEDQNLRLREQLDMLQQEVDELRGQRHADSEEGFAEHSEGSLPADLSQPEGARRRPIGLQSDAPCCVSGRPALLPCDAPRVPPCAVSTAAGSRPGAPRPRALYTNKVAGGRRSRAGKVLCAAMAAATVLPLSVTRHIADKLYDKRKLAALEVEQLVKQLSASGNVQRISAVIDALVSQYATSSQSNARKGGLLCLAATAVALATTPGTSGARPPDLLQRIVPPILVSFTDQDSRVRYYAIESLWNVAKSTRESFLQVFPDVFDALFRLCSDPDANVQNATAFLDRLVKDIVAESHEFDVGGFIPTLQESLEVSNPFKRQFLLGWLALLDSLPDIDLAAHLPALLPGLLGMLSDGNAEVRSACTKLLQEFLLEVQTSGGGTDVSGLALILAQQLEQRRDEEAALLTALRWLHTLVQLAPKQLLPHTAALLREVLPCLGHADPDISAAARQVNSDLLEQVQQQQQQQRGLSSSSSSLDSQALLAAVSKQLEGETEVSKLEALQWVHVLLSRDARLLQEQRQLLLLALCDALGAASDRVVTESLSVLASVAEQRDHFPAVIAALLDCFRGNGGARLLQRRGGLVIQQLSQKLGGLRVYRELSRLLQEEDDASFAGAVVQALNLILLTSSQLQELRALLQSSLRSAEAADVFSQLFASWSYSCAASLSLALLAQAHTLACELLAAMAQEPLSMRPETTVELTQLVGLLEAPAFAPLRLQLLQPQQFPALQRAVHGLLMLLPQGDAFRMLQARLAPIPIMAMLSLRDAPAPAQQPSSGGLSAAGSAAALAQSPSQPAGSPAGSPRESGSWAGLDPSAASPEQESSLSPRQRQQGQRPRLMQLEEKRLVQLFKSRASRLG
ncbi:VAC14-like protein isoform X1 [Chlorella sorokiniana]|uniref:VAC14-like protein isoform X1 n=1 Tax=Chlorella sorokiniana TaxID=3076 RepID=A0A2P6U1W8_CHLSO|nr:VAC14-like protein isoform X1 [Chlorella sorokiniana]|eukprot:PRW60313.1 VAC14-like protein isoform X1 [Chlorella sorokiniana]